MTADRYCINCGRVMVHTGGGQTEGSDKQSKKYECEYCAHVDYVTADQEAAEQFADDFIDEFESYHYGRAFEDQE